MDLTGPIPNPVYTLAKADRTPLSRDSYKPLFVYLELQTPTDPEKWQALTVGAPPDGGSALAPSNIDPNARATNGIKVEMPSYPKSGDYQNNLYYEGRAAWDKLQSATQVNQVPSLVTTLKQACEDAQDVDASGIAGDEQKDMAFDPDDGTVYKRTVIPVDAHLISLHIEEEAESLVWFGEMELFDPAAVDNISNVFFNQAPVGDYRMLLRFGSDYDLLQSAPTYFGVVTQIKTHLRPEGVMYNISLISKASGLNQIRKGFGSPKIGVKSADTWALIFKKIADKGNWTLYGFDLQLMEGIFDEAIGSDVVMAPGESLVEFAQRLCRNYHAASPQGDRIYFKILTLPGDDEEKGQVQYFFGTESFARSQRIKKEKQVFTYGGPNSNVIEADFNDNIMATALLGVSRSVGSLYDTQKSASKLYAVKAGILEEVKTSKDLDALVKKFNDNRKYVTEIPVQPLSSPEATKAALRAYLDRLAKAQIEVSVTVPGNHSVLVYDLFAFYYLAQSGSEYTNSYLSGDYTAQHLAHHIVGGQWTTTYAGYRFSKETDRNHLALTSKENPSTIIEVKDGESMEEAVRRLFGAQVPQRPKEATAEQNFEILHRQGRW